jgi:hypothetical protein
MRARKIISLLTLFLLPTIVSVNGYLSDPSIPKIHLDNPTLEYTLISLFFLAFIPVIWLMRKAQKQNKERILEEN